jgi:lysyl-tRNA synthetase class 2
LTYQGQKIDLTPPWRRITVKEALLQYAGVRRRSGRSDKAVAYAKGIGLETEAGAALGKTMMLLFEASSKNC